MKVTTSWKFRKKNLPSYTREHFETDWDYFVYLHINSQVQLLHLCPTLIALCYFPRAFYLFCTQLSIWPMALFTFLYYGMGFISHYIGDGQISRTWSQLGLTYYYAVRMNVLLLRGKFKDEERRLFEKYPHTLWVYFVDEKAPATALTALGLRESRPVVFQTTP